MVRGKLHYKGSGLAGEHLGLFQHDAGDDDGGHADKVGGGSDPCSAAKDRAGDHGDEGYLRAAGDEGGGHDGHTAVTLVFNGTGGHDARDAAAGADEHGDEGLTGQTKLPEDPVQNEGDTGHVAAGLQEGQHQKQHQHLRNKAQHSANAGHDAVQDQAGQPFRRIGLFQQVAHQHGNAGNPYAVIRRIGLVKAVFCKVADGVQIAHLDHCIVLLLTGGDGVIIDGHVVDGQRLFVLHLNDGGVRRRNDSLHLRQCGVCVEGLVFEIQLIVAADRVAGGGVFICGIAVSGGADAQQMPAIAEQAVVGPVGGGRAHADHSDPVHQEHHDRKDGQTQPTAGDHLVDLVRGRQTALVFLLIAALDDAGDVDIALVGDDGFGIIIQLRLGGLDVRFDMLHHIGRNAQLLQNLVVPLEDLDGVPALLLLGHIVDGGLLDVGDGVLHGAGEGVGGDGLGGLGGFHGGLRGLHDAIALQGGDLNDLAAQLTGKLRHVDLVAALADHIHHVDGDDHRDAQLGELRGQIKVALQVGAVDDVQDGVGPLADQIIPGHHLFQRVGREGINAGQIHDDHVVMLLQLAFLFLNGNARPVSHELIGAGQRVEQRCLTAVWVARQGDLDLFVHCAAPFG